MSRFHGKYESKIDEKGRLLLPQAFAEIFRNNDCNEVYLAPHPDFCIMVFGKHLELENAGEDLRPVIKAEKWLCKLDSGGYLTIPQALRSYAGFAKDVVIIGFGLRFEIWSKERWNQFDQHLRSMFNLALSEDFMLNSDLARKLLSDAWKKSISMKRWTEIRNTLRKTSERFHKKFPEHRTLKDFLEEFDRDHPHAFITNTLGYVQELKQFILTSSIKERDSLFKVLDIMVHGTQFHSLGGKRKWDKGEYVIWDIKGQKPASESKIGDLRNKNREGEIDIFVDDDGVVYFKGKKVVELKKPQILYDFLMYFLKNKGVGGTYENLFCEVWPIGKEKKLKPSFEISKTQKGNVIRMKNRLHGLLKNYDVKEIKYEYNRYRLDEDCNFFVIQKSIG